MNLIINTDGASRGNPGPASYGFIIKEDSGLIIHQEGKKIGVTTNNVAEYTAVLSALKYVSQYQIKKAPHSIQVITDSKLIAQQLSGRFKLKSPHLIDLFKKVKSLEDGLGVVTYQNVPREQNFIADKLANQALDNLI